MATNYPPHTWTTGDTVQASDMNNIEQALGNHVHIDAQAPLASATVTGLVRLTGDLGGTSSAPTVPGLAAKAPTANPTFTGTVTVPTPANGTDAATKAYVDSAASGATVPNASATVLGKVQLTGDLGGTATAPTVPGLASKAPLASPTFTGTVTVPTPVNGTDAATKAYADSAVASGTPDATTTTKGKLQLAGDLAGTAALPTVPGLANKVNTTTTVNGHALSANVTVTANDVLPTQTGNAGKALVTDGTNPSWGTVTATVYKTFAFSKTGTLAVTTGVSRIYNDTGSTLTISKARASVGTAPTGASIIVDVLKNGATVFTTTANRPTIAAAANTGLSGTPDVTAWLNGDYLTVNVSQVGSTVAGSDLTVTVVAS